LVLFFGLWVCAEVEMTLRFRSIDMKVGLAIALFLLWLGFLMIQFRFKRQSVPKVGLFIEVRWFNTLLKEELKAVGSEA
jgi:hypothetical protein